MLFSALLNLSADARLIKLVQRVLSLALYNTTFPGVVDIFKYPRHQLIIINEATSALGPRLINFCHSDDYTMYSY